ncbi:hypothetical protein [Actinoplanes sp. G11-F43]|uniref:hypothetical protein n=1 Tax=Actinoplanes sp. G11-F43 TaxID=3424130 RepID=UPI003D3510B3
MDVITQWVRIAWTKQSRGGAAAIRRNALPTLFPLPETGGPLLHEIDMREWQDFVPRASVSHEPPADLGLRETGDLLHVKLTPAQGGNPARWYERPAVTLTPGRWMRWRINYRFNGRWSNDGYYRLDTLHLTYRGGAFTGPPAHDLDDRADLY